MATSGLPDWPWAGTVADDLPHQEKLVLDAIRAWHSASRAGTPPLPAAALVLTTEDATAAAPPLDALLRTAPIAAGCPFCMRVAPQEAALLLACALAQRGARSEALAALLRLLPLQAAYAAMPAAIHLGCALRRAGLLLRHPIREAMRPPPGGAGVTISAASTRARRVLGSPSLRVAFARNSRLARIDEGRADDAVQVVSLNNSRPISMRRISLVPAPIS